MLILLLAGCGATGGAGGGSAHLPASGSGPFSPLEMQPNDDIDAPVVLTNPAIDLDDPSVIADGAKLSVWVTGHRSGGDDIERADAGHVRGGFSDLETVLTADQPWEGGGVSAPAVLKGDPWILFYWGNGGIGCATSTDGQSWTKLPGPILPGAGPPAAMRVGDKVRVFYPLNGSLHAADSSDLATWTDLGEVVNGVSFGVGLGRAFARAGKTAAGRTRYDLYFTVNTPDPMSPTTCGFAGSWDGLHFETGATAIVDPKQVTRGPAETPYSADGIEAALLLFVERQGARAVVMAGKSP